MTYGKSYTYCVKKQRNFYIKKIDIDEVNNINTENSAYYFIFFFFKNFNNRAETTKSLKILHIITSTYYYSSR